MFIEYNSAYFYSGIILIATLTYISLLKLRPDLNNKFRKSSIVTNANRMELTQKGK